MNPQRYQQVKELFLAACELDDGQIAALLDQKCADDPELREEVESLLEHRAPTVIASELPNATPELDETRDLSTERRPAPFHKPKTDRFFPGAVIAGRYRLLGRLGQGGMGEVFRADDLKLDQPVALKFLTQSRTHDTKWLARFHAEVRLARRVTHANVNRVYDIGEADGEAFISMEYVDGEDLASLLRRIGRLPGDKALEITRQLCAGLGAAHDQGVLHRDLKPANIMIDGRGHVRITDFGIAALTDDGGGESPLAGTPAFMAPELFRGKPPSKRSDLYALGVLLYELVSGKEPFGGQPPNQRTSDRPPTSPSTWSTDIDPVLERLILQCLERDPKRRPESVHAIAAALPGGDPLAAALAAGETPSPSMVAAAGATDRTSSTTALVCLAAGLLGLVGVVLLADHTFFLPQAGLEEPPAVLARQAQDIIEKFGHKTDRPGRTQGFSIDRDYFDYTIAKEKGPGRWDALSTGRPPAVFFWYRQGDRRLVPPAPFGEPALMRKLPAEPGMCTVRLDCRRRLLWFAAHPRRHGLQSTSPAGPDWSEAFTFAKLRLDDFSEVEPTHQPPMFADRVIAWQGTYPDQPATAIRVEAASLGERIVFFHVVPPWQVETPPGTDPHVTSSPTSRTFVVRSLFYITALAGGLVLAWRNVRLGRGDQNGARRLAGFVFVLALLDWIVGERHVSVFVEEVASSYLWVAGATFAGATTWVIYIALEPYVRRLWPQTMITWSRLLKGCVRDPQLGRDVMIGALIGILFVLVAQVDMLLPTWLDRPAPVPKLPGSGYDLGELLGLRYKIGVFTGLLLSAISFGLISLMLMLLLRVAVRIPWLAALAFCILLTAAMSTVAASDTFLPLLTTGIVAAGIVFTLTRVGLVATIAALFVRSMLIVNPITAHFEVWYAPASAFAVLMVAAILIVAAYHALAGQPILARWLVDE